MLIDEKDQAVVSGFRSWFRERLAGDERFVGPAQHDAADGSTLMDRWEMGEHVWLELAVRPLIPQVRVGVVTDDRWKSEEMEQLIEDSGDTMSEYVELAMEEVGLSWPDPPVEHFRDQGKYFYFATAVEADPISLLGDEDFRRRARQAFEGYYKAFEKFARSGGG